MKTIDRLRKRKKTFKLGVKDVSMKAPRKKVETRNYSNLIWGILSFLFVLTMFDQYETFRLRKNVSELNEALSVTTETIQLQNQSIFDLQQKLENARVRAKEESKPSKKVIEKRRNNFSPLPSRYKDRGYSD